KHARQRYQCDGGGTADAPWITAQGFSGTTDLPPSDIAIFIFMSRQPPRPTLFPYTTLFRSRPHPRQCPAPRSARPARVPGFRRRSEEHTSELQSRGHLVCRLLLEKKNAADLRDGPRGTPCRAAGRLAVARRTAVNDLPYDWR